MKLDDFKKPMIYGVISVFIILIIEFLVFNFCKNDLGCLVFGFLPALPSFIFRIHAGTILGMFVNLLFYFLLGALVGFLVQKFKK